MVAAKKLLNDTIEAVRELSTHWAKRNVSFATCDAHIGASQIIKVAFTCEGDLAEQNAWVS